MSQNGTEPMKVGLALSGGGAKGLAHIGVIKVLEEMRIPIDYIAGTSMGSVIGGLYAAGQSIEDLERIAIETDWDGLFSDAPRRRYLSMEQKRFDGRYIGSLPLRNRAVGLPSGVIAGQRVNALLTRLTLPVHHIQDFHQLPIPFVSVATDIENGDAVVLDHGYLPHAIRASMSIPSVFTPIEYDGRLLVDGGVVRNLPAQDVLDMGADYVICVDVSALLETRDKLNSITNILVQTISIGLREKTEAQQKKCDLLILPDVLDVGSMDFDDTEMLLRLGEEAVRAMTPQLTALAARFPEDAVPNRSFQWRDSVYVTEIDVEGKTRIQSPVIVELFKTPLPAWLTADELEDKIEQLYNTRLFEQVTYRIEPGEAASRLVLQVQEGIEDKVYLGFRYDQRNEFSFLSNITLRNFGLQGSRANLELQVGDRFAITGEYYLRRGFWAQIRYTNRSYEAFSGNDRFAEFRFRSLSAEAFGGSFLSTSKLYGFGLRLERAVTDPRIAPVDFTKEGVTLLMPVARFQIDTQDRVVFPTSGHFFFFESLGSHKNIISEVSMSQHRLIWRGAYRLSSRWVLETDVEVAASFGTVPQHRVLTLGGVTQPPFVLGRFVGLKPDQVAGRFLKKIGLDFRYRLAQDRFLTLHTYVGNAVDEWEWNVAQEKILWSLGLTLGLNTVIGPIEFTFATSSEHTTLYDINVGYKF